MKITFYFVNPAFWSSNSLVLALISLSLVSSLSLQLVIRIIDITLKHQHTLDNSKILHWICGLEKARSILIEKKYLPENNMIFASKICLNNFEVFFEGDLNNYSKWPFPILKFRLIKVEEKDSWKKYISYKYSKWGKNKLFDQKSSIGDRKNKPKTFCVLVSIVKYEGLSSFLMLKSNSLANMLSMYLCIFKWFQCLLRESVISSLSFLKTLILKPGEL